MKYFVFLLIVCSFSSVKADFCDPNLWQNIATPQIRTGIYVQGWDVNQDCLDENGQPTTPLHIAVANTQNINALTAFIMEGADVLAVNDAGQTPYAVLWELDKVMYGQVQQATYRWNNLIKEEYEQARNRIIQGIQNESDPDMADEMATALQEIQDMWEDLGRIPFDEAQARYSQVQQTLGVIRLFTQTRLAMLSSEYETYTPMVTDETYNEARDTRDFITFVNEKLMALSLDPITSNSLPMLFGFEYERNFDLPILSSPTDGYEAEDGVVPAASSPVHVPEDTKPSSDMVDEVVLMSRFFGLFNDLRNLFDQLYELCPANARDLCEVIHDQINEFSTPLEITFTASTLWDLIYNLNAIYRNINDLVLRRNAAEEYEEQIIDNIRDELVILEVEVRDRFGNDTRETPAAEVVPMPTEEGLGQPQPDPVPSDLPQEEAIEGADYGRGDASEPDDSRIPAASQRPETDDGSYDDEPADDSHTSTADGDASDSAESRPVIGVTDEGSIVRATADGGMIVTTEKINSIPVELSIGKAAGDSESGPVIGMTHEGNIIRATPERGIIITTEKINPMPVTFSIDEEAQSTEPSQVGSPTPVENLSSGDDDGHGEVPAQPSPVVEPSLQAQPSPVVEPSLQAQPASDTQGELLDSLEAGGEVASAESPGDIEAFTDMEFFTEMNQALNHIFNEYESLFNDLNDLCSNPSSQFRFRVCRSIEGLLDDLDEKFAINATLDIHAIEQSETTVANVLMIVHSDLVAVYNYLGFLFDGTDSTNRERRTRAGNLREIEKQILGRFNLWPDTARQ